MVLDAAGRNYLERANLLANHGIPAEQGHILCFYALQFLQRSPEGLPGVAGIRVAGGNIQALLTDLQNDIGRIRGFVFQGFFHQDFVLHGDGDHARIRGHFREDGFHGFFLRDGEPLIRKVCLEARQETPGDRCSGIPEGHQALGAERQQGGAFLVAGVPGIGIGLYPGDEFHAGDFRGDGVLVTYGHIQHLLGKGRIRAGEEGFLPHLHLNGDACGRQGVGYFLRRQDNRQQQGCRHKEFLHYFHRLWVQR